MKKISEQYELVETYEATIAEVFPELIKYFKEKYNYETN